MIELKPEFQKKLFTKLLNSIYSIKFSKIIEQSSKIDVFYKNCKVKSLSVEVINKAIKLADVSKEELIKNTLKTYFAKERRKQSN
jgi:hypothetical protein